jgi:DMSO/TMAO reductase YedYZ heme-binding membrane subunit
MRRVLDVYFKCAGRVSRPSCSHAVDLVESAEIRVVWCIWVIMAPLLQLVAPPSLPPSYNAAATTAILLLAFLLLTWNPKSIYKKNGLYIFLN